MRIFKLLSISLICLFITGLAYGQGLGASGDIKGTVTDPTGAIVANATVTVTDAAKGVKRTGATDSSGEFHVTGLAPSTYSVSVSKSGFQSEISKNVVVNVGQTTSMDFHMKVSQVSEQIEVTSEAAVVETDKAQQSEVISLQTIQDLPINRRDYLTFTLLAPAVSDSTRLASDQDFRVKQTPQSGLSFYGSNGRGNSVTVDGGEANDDAGGVRLNLGQDAVQEFQINRSNYGAELGGASGATINIVSKSGTNNVHGSLFAFFRNDAMDAANPFSKTQALAPGAVFNPASPDAKGANVKDTLTREQFGGSIGFPITHDKTFLFGSFEGLMADAQNAVPLLTNTSIFRPNGGQQSIITGLAGLAGNPAVPCLTGQPALPAATCAGILTNILTISNVPTASPLNKYIVSQLEANGGNFPYNSRQYLASARLDHQFSDRNTTFLRYSFAHDKEENPDVQSLVGFSRGSSVNPAFDHTLLGAWFHQFNSNASNEARAQYNYSNFDVVPNFPGQAGLDIPGFANLGTNIFLPSFTIMRRYEVADNFTTIRGHHTMKMGATFLYRGNHTESHTFFPGRFVFGNLPGGILSPCLQVPAACGLTAAPSTINPLQSVSLGLPQFFQQGFGNPNYNYPRPYTSAFFQDSWRVKPNLTLNAGVRYELDSQYGALATDSNNIAPRVSFAWDPFNDKKTVIRAGYGIFFSPIYGQIADVVQTLGLVNGNRQIAQIFVPLTGAPGNPTLTSAKIFQTLFAQGKIQCSQPTSPNVSCITPTDLAQPGLNIAITNSGPVPPLTVLFSGQPNYQNPYSQQAEFGVEREVTAGWSASLSGIYVHTIGLPVAIDRNPLATAPLSAPVTLANGTQVRFKQWSAAFFANPLLLQDNVYSSKGSALYEGAVLTVQKRMSHHYSLFASYTLSKAFGTTTDFNSDFGPQDQTNLAAERGLSDFDQRHKVVTYAAIDTGKTGNAFFSNFTIAPIFRYNSGHPFNLLAGSDVNGDRHSTNDRPIGAAHNTGQGPDFFSFDMRISRRMKLSERSELQILAEGFNLFNRVNYASVNNIVGPNFGQAAGFTTFNVKGSAALSPSSPLGFTSAYPMRQLQLGARIAF
ncbi:MAG TPA: TonB-dependent receptor [Terriglobales bacterium]|nr:TonB-dependent receptor [Terriglobales bacterium]